MKNEAHSGERSLWSRNYLSTTSNRREHADRVHGLHVIHGLRVVHSSTSTRAQESIICLSLFPFAMCLACTVNIVWTHPWQIFQKLPSSTKSAGSLYKCNWICNSSSLHEMVFLSNLSCVRFSTAQTKPWGPPTCALPIRNEAGMCYWNPWTEPTLAQNCQFGGRFCGPRKKCQFFYCSVWQWVPKNTYLPHIYNINYALFTSNSHFGEGIFFQTRKTWHVRHVSNAKKRIPEHFKYNVFRKNASVRHCESLSEK